MPAQQQQQQQQETQQQQKASQQADRLNHSQHWEQQDLPPPHYC
jgi:hypothetical protein